MSYSIPASSVARHSHKTEADVAWDYGLIMVACAIITLGFIMLSSASISVSEQYYSDPFHLLTRQAIFLVMGVVGAALMTAIPIAFWRSASGTGLIIGVLLLLVVLIPGIGHEVNGSTRWIHLGITRFQPSECVKLAWVMYLASYCMRYQADIEYDKQRFLMPMLLLGAVVFLLLMEPDFGASVVLIGTTLGMLFLAGVRLRYFVGCLVPVILGLLVIALTSPYRLQRLTSFLNPWDEQYSSGYQLTQALIAFGRGEWLGLGLGNSVQKLFYLPEAHTDFLFAVLAEELGLVGAVGTIVLYVLLILKTFKMGLLAHKAGQIFAGQLAFGIALLWAIQVSINIGVNLGVLPTKGLALPFMSYGGTSLVINCVMLGILLRLRKEI